MCKAEFDKLLDHGDDLEDRFDSLRQRQRETAPDKEASKEVASQLSMLVNEIKQWLGECTEYGRFLHTHSEDRRILQGRISYWKSLLSQSGYLLPEIDRLADFDPTAGFPLDVPFPYRGLQAYTENDRNSFYGREREAKDYVADLEERNNALLLVSESGGGKSSLAMAGILPQLTDTHPDWLFAQRMTPGANPVEALRDALSKDLPILPANGAVQPVVEALDGRMLVLFIDQLEELLTLCNDNQQQANFSALVCALAESGKCRVLATMRMDYLDQLANSQSCRSLYKLLAANKGVKILEPLDFDAIRIAILKPAQTAGLRFVPPEIVDKLAQQTANLVGGLPLLQFALWRLWESRPERDGSKLDLINEGQMEKLPSVQAALGKAATEQYRDLLKEYDLRLMLVNKADGLVNEGRNLVIVAFVGPNLHIRIFDANGNRVTDKAENELISEDTEDTLTTLKGQLSPRPLPDVSGLSQERKCEIIQDAASIADHILPEQKACKRLMLELTIPSENFQDPMRRRRRESEVVDLLVRYENTDREKVKKLIVDFVNAKLLVKTGEGENAQLEVAHEAIFRNWETFRKWVSSEETKSRLQAIRSIGREAAEWTARGQAADYLKLQGKPLKDALGYEEGGWLDKASSTYVKACKSAEQNHHQKIQRWFRVAMVVIFLFLIFISAGPALVLQLWNSWQKEANAVAAANNLISLASKPKLQPWEALDLTNALYQKLGTFGDFSAPLAHAVDRMKGTQMLGNRDFVIDFTQSGEAVIQFERDEKNLNIYPIDDKGILIDDKGIPQPVTINLGDNKQYPLEWAPQVEVSPVDPAAGNTRLALLVVKRQGQSRSMEIQGHRLPAKIGEAADNKAMPLGDPIQFDWVELYKEGKPQISFDASGRFAVLTERKSVDKGMLSNSRVIVFGVGGVTGNTLETHEIAAPPALQATASDSLGNEDVVTAVAFRGDWPGAPDATFESVTWDSLVTGRLNGTLYCGSERLLKPEGYSSDRNPVILIRVAPGTGRFVALQQSNAMIGGDCDSKKVVPIQSGSSSAPPRSIMYRKIGFDKTRLSYVQAGSLWCVEFDEKMHSTATRDCGLAPLSFFQAVPIPGRDSFLVIEDRYTPAVFTLKVDTAAGIASDASSTASKVLFTRVAGYASVSWERPTGGEPLACRGEAQGKVKWMDRNDKDEYLALYVEGPNVSRAAVSPDGMYVVWIESCEQDNQKKTILYRWARNNESVFPLPPGGSYGAVAVNNKGEVAVTTRDKLFFYASDGSEKSESSLDLGKCVAFSPDGKMTLVGDADSNAHLYDENYKPVGNVSSRGRVENRGEPVSCAVSDNGTAVISLNDGQVLLQELNKDELKPISELVPFRLTQRMRAVSIDPTGRFVAVLGVRQSDNCLRPAIGGQSVQLWDLNYHDSIVIYISRYNMTQSLRIEQSTS